MATSAAATPPSLPTAGASLSTAAAAVADAAAAGGKAAAAGGVTLTLPHFIKLCLLYRPNPDALTPASVGSDDGVHGNGGGGMSAAAAAAATSLAASLPPRSCVRRILLALARGAAPVTAASLASQPAGAGRDDLLLVSVSDPEPMPLPFPQPFARAVLCVGLRYASLQGGAANGGGNQAAAPAEVFDVLQKRLGVTGEAFASPLNCRFDRYFSAFPDTDAAFGSLGSFFRVRSSVHNNPILIAYLSSFLSISPI